MPASASSGATLPTAGGGLAAPAAAAPRARRDLLTSVAICLALASIYSANREVLPGQDATGNAYLAANIVEEGRLSFSPSQDPWLFNWTLVREGRVIRLASLGERLGGVPAGEMYAQGRIVPSTGYFLTASVRTGGGTGETLYVNTFGPGTALAAVPVMAAIRPFSGDLREHPEALWFGAKLAASLLVAGSAVFVFLTARMWLARGPAAALALAYGLGTAVWSTSSQTLWQHGASELFIAAGVYFLSRARGSPRDAALCGVSLAAAVACRPTSALVAAAAAGYLLVVDRRAFAALALAALPIALAMGAYNAHYLGSAFRFGQTEMSRSMAVDKTGSPDLWQTPILTGVAGVLASPSRGVFVFSPWLVLAIPGAVLAWRAPGWGPLRALSVAALAMLLVESRWYDWWGGWSYGWRRVVDLAPLLAILVTPVAARRGASRGAIAAVAVAVGWSVLVQALGAFAYDVYGWNGKTVFAARFAGGETAVIDSRDEATALARLPGGPAIEQRSLDVDAPENRRRLWSLHDNQIGYYVAHLSSACEAKRAASADWISQWRLGGVTYVR